MSDVPVVFREIRCTGRITVPTLQIVAESVRILVKLRIPCVNLRFLVSITQERYMLNSSWLRLLRAALLVICCALFNSRTASGDEWQPVTQDELKMTSLPEAPGAPAVILYKQVDRNDFGIQRGRGAGEYNYVRIKIFTEEGRKYANVEIPFLKQRSSISAIRARTIRPDGIVRMTSTNVPAFVEEDHMPPVNEVKFRVVFIYRDEPFEPNMDKYWKQWGKKANGKAEGFADKRKAMEEAVNGIVAAGDAPEVKLRKIYDRVQQIKNLSYLPRMSAEQIKQENLKEPGNVEELWKAQYGHGWQLTWLFLGLARAAGFEAYPCFVAQRNETFFRKDRVDGRELSDNVVLVRVAGKDQYFDPGAALTPFGLLPWV